MRLTTTRRRLLGTGAAALAATAGCLSATGTEQDGPGTTETASATDTESAPTTPPDDPEAWLADANGYDGERRRFTPSGRPTIEVGHPTEDGPAFSPPVVEVAPGTTVTWDWTGEGGRHDVLALDGTFDSGRTNAQHGTSYRHSFEERGTYPYVCEPHREDGMKGAVVVADPPSTGIDRVDEWMVVSDAFDGEVTDRTGDEAATVTVGAEGNRGTFAFAPDVLRVSVGTTIAWEWTGAGGAHDVTFPYADVSSGDPVAEPGVHFEHAFAEPGTYLYACRPHEGLGMRGAVVVE